MKFHFFILIHLLVLIYSLMYDWSSTQNGRHTASKTSLDLVCLHYSELKKQIWNFTRKKPFQKDCSLVKFIALYCYGKPLQITIWE